MGWLHDWKKEKKKHKIIYRELRDYANTYGFCWACGRTANDKPESYHAPWMIQRAHICNQPRIEDRRMVNLLCPLCHDNYDGKVSGDRQITLAHMINLKGIFDPDYLDLELIQKCSIRNIPSPEELQSYWLAEFRTRRGLTRVAITA